MSKLKSFFADKMSDVKRSFSNYPATYLISILSAIALAIVYDLDKLERVFEYVLAFAGTSILVFWLCEIILFKMPHRIIGYVVSIISGIVWAVLLVDHNKELPGIHRILIGYVVVHMCLCIYFIMRKLKVNSFKYILDVFQNMFFYSIIYVVINMGITAVLSVFISLILDDSFYSLVMRWQILLLGAFYVPAIILALSKEKSHISLFIKNLVKYVLYPITLIATLVIYMYIVKILVLHKMPSNSVYEIVMCIFIYGYLSFIMVKNYAKDNKFYNISTKVYPWVFIPLIILQSYSLIVRVLKYSWTVQRYLGVAFIIVEVIVLLMTLYIKKDVLEKALLLIAIIAVVTSMSPINVERVSVESQVKRLVKEWPKGKKFNELNNKEKCNLYYTYEYINGSNKRYKKLYMKKYIEDKKYIEIDELKEFDDTYEGPDDIELDDDDISLLIEFDKSDKKVDVSQYKKVKFIDDSTIDKEEYVKFVDKIVRKNGSKLEDKLNKDNIMKYDDDTDICILYLEAEYFEEKNKKDEIEIIPGQYYLKALLLEK